MVKASDVTVCAVVAVAGVEWEPGIVFTEETLVAAGEEHEELTYDAYTKKLYYLGPLDGVEGAKGALAKDLGLEDDHGPHT